MTDPRVYSLCTTSADEHLGGAVTLFAMPPRLQPARGAKGRMRDPSVGGGGLFRTPQRGTHSSPLAHAEQLADAEC